MANSSPQALLAAAKKEASVADELHIYALHKGAQELLQEYSAAKEIPIDYIFPAALVAASIAVGSSVTVQAPGFPTKPIIWAMTSGEPSSGKSGPVRDIMSPIIPVDDHLRTESEKALGAYKQEYALALKNGSKELPPQPAYKALRVVRTTGEKLDSLLCQNPHGLVWDPDELGTVLEDLTRYNSSKGDRFVLMSVWKGYGITTDRINREGDHASSAFLSIVGTITNANVLKYFDNAYEDGFAPRWLIFHRSYEEGVDARNPDDKIMEKWGKVWNRMYSQATEYPSRSLYGSPEALEVAKAFKRRIISMRKKCEKVEDEADIKALYGKGPEYVWRIAAIIHLVNEAYAALAGEAWPSEITESEMENAADIFFYSCNNHQVLVFSRGYQSNPQGRHELIRAIFKIFPKAKRSALAIAIGVSLKTIDRATKPLRDVYGK